MFCVMTCNTYSFWFEIKHDLLWLFWLIMNQYNMIGIFKENRPYQHAFDKIKCENQYAIGFAFPFWFSYLYELSRNVFCAIVVFLYGTDVILKEKPFSFIFISAVLMCNRMLRKFSKCQLQFIYCLFWNKTWFVVVILVDYESI